MGFLLFLLAMMFKTSNVFFLSLIIKNLGDSTKYVIRRSASTVKPRNMYIKYLQFICGINRNAIAHYPKAKNT